MKETGMLFTTDMVQAIIDGRKTQTRRLINKFPASGYKWAGWITDSTCKKDIGNAVIIPKENEIWNQCRAIYAKPSVNVGDRIYVRETWQEAYDRKNDSWKPIYFADSKNKIWIDDGEIMKWKPSLHMPKSYARIWLDVTGVMVQKISDITNDEAVCEGFSDRNCFISYMINKYGNDVINSWCWVIKFRRSYSETGVCLRLYFRNR
jgi:hypothetical protein